MFAEAVAMDNWMGQWDVTKIMLGLPGQCFTPGRAVKIQLVRNDIVNGVESRLLIMS